MNTHPLVGTLLTQAFIFSIPPVSLPIPIPSSRYSNNTEVMAVFGGRHENKYVLNDTHHTVITNYTYFNDLIFYYPHSNTWKTVKPSTTTLPPNRDHHAATYLASEKKLYILGGRATNEKSSMGTPLLLFRFLFLYVCVRFFGVENVFDLFFFSPLALISSM